MMEHPIDTHDAGSLQGALRRLEAGISAVRAGDLETSVELEFAADHPLGALAQAINEMTVALGAAKVARLLQESELEERLLTIQQQNAAIQELSSPVIEVWPGVLTLPVMGYIDAERATNMTTSLLEQVVRRRASLAIIDMTGMNGVGAEVLDHIMRMARCVKLLGAGCGVSGVRPEVARMIVELGSELGEVRSYPTLRVALMAHIGGPGSGKRPQGITNPPGRHEEKR